MFGFNQDINTVQNLSFNEPCQLRIVWGPTFDLAAKWTFAGNTSVAGPAGVCSKPQLALRYKMYNEADNAMILSENYSEPQLNMLTSRQYRENPVRETSSGANVVKFDNVSLKNVDVVKAFYIMVRPVVVSGASTQNPNASAQNQKVTSVKLSAAGQEICTITEQQNFYSKLTENGYAVQSSTALMQGVGYSNVFKIQTGLWENAGGGPMSNGWSLRELNNLTITVEAETLQADTAYELTVCESCATVLSTSSNTGRMTNALSN